MIADTLILVVVGLVAYAALIAFSIEYGRRTGWQSPEGTTANDWALRQKVGLGLGALAVVAGAIACSVLITDWLARLLVMAQAAVMAAAGASDLRRFHLPLPLTLLGIVLAIASLSVLSVPPLMLIFGLAWSVAVIALHALLSKGSMQLGDHIATVWIALAMPFNGLLAVMLGDFANVIFARTKGMGGKKVAVAGSWLVIAAAILALPPYFAWFNGSLSAKTTQSAQLSQIDVQQVAVAMTHPKLVLAADTNPNARAIVTMLDLAGDHTATVALEDTRESRVARAMEASRSVALLATSAQLAGAEPHTIDMLMHLSEALANYDLAGVRGSTAQIAAERALLAQRLPA